MMKKTQVNILCIGQVGELCQTKLIITVFFAVKKWTITVKTFALKNAKKRTKKSMRLNQLDKKITTGDKRVLYEHAIHNNGHSHLLCLSTISIICVLKIRGDFKMLSIRQKIGLIIVRPLCILLRLICMTFNLAFNVNVGVMERRQLDTELLSKIKRAIDDKFNDYPRA